MPVVNDIPPQPYPNLGDVLQLARVLVNDAFGPNGIEGDILASSQPQTIVYVNSAWEQFQDELIESGVETFTKEVYLPSLPAVTLLDPSAYVYITWDGYFDGTTFQPIGDQVPVLPFDFIQPASEGVWERVTGSAASFTQVIPWDAGLPQGYPLDKLRYYEWRDDKLYFKGATQATDLKLRYVAYRPEFATDNTGTVDETQLVPVMRSRRALAYFIASEYSRTRGADAADNLYAMGESEVAKIARRSSHRKAVVSYRRKSFGSC